MFSEAKKSCLSSCTTADVANFSFRFLAISRVSFFDCFSGIDLTGGHLGGHTHIGVFVPNRGVPNVKEEKHVCKYCRSRNLLSNDYLLAKIGSDTEENEPSTV